jgi:hypothetical protein
MSRSYEMAVIITGFEKSRLQKIKKACRAEWDFEQDEFSVDGDAKSLRALTGHGISSLCGGESEEEFSDRLSKAVWKANGKYCGVEVQALYLDATPPSDDHVRGEDDYERLMGKAVKHEQ